MSTNRERPELMPGQPRPVQDPAHPYFTGLDREYRNIQVGQQPERQCRGRNGWFTPRSIQATPIPLTGEYSSYISVDVYSSAHADTAPIILNLSPANAFAMMKQLAHAMVDLWEKGDNTLNQDELWLAGKVADFPIFHGGIGEGPEFDPNEYASEHVQKERNEHRWMVHDLIFTASRTNDGVELNVKGYGTADMPDDQGAVLALDYHAGKLQAIAHPDINSDDITVVPLVNAAIITREDQSE